MSSSEFIDDIGAGGEGDQHQPKPVPPLKLVEEIVGDGLGDGEKEEQTKNKGPDNKTKLSIPSKMPTGPGPRTTITLIPASPQEQMDMIEKRYTKLGQGIKNLLKSPHASNIIAGISGIVSFPLQPLSPGIQDQTQTMVVKKLILMKFH